MLDDTLVVWGGEFGRTSYSQGKLTATNYGRDHHPRCFTVWMAGGGVKAGISYGATDDFAYNVTEHPVHVHDFHATLLHLLGHRSRAADLLPSGPPIQADRRPRPGCPRAPRVTAVFLKASGRYHWGDSQSRSPSAGCARSRAHVAGDAPGETGGGRGGTPAACPGPPRERAGASVSGTNRENLHGPAGTAAGARSGTAPNRATACI